MHAIEPRPDDIPGQRRPLAGLIPFLIFLYPAVYGVWSIFQIPHFIDKRVLALAILDSAIVLAYLLVIYSFWSRRYSLHQLCIFSLVLISIALGESNDMRRIPGILLVAQLTRMCCGVSIIALAFGRYRRIRRMDGAGFIGLGVLVLLLCASDLALLVKLRMKPTGETQGASSAVTFRETYDLSKIRPSDVLIVGDSIVWGWGVKEYETSGRQLENLYRSEGKNKSVYSLAVCGANPADYCAFLAMVPPGVTADRVVMSFYLNDMPFRPSLLTVVEHLGMTFGILCPTVRFMADRVNSSREWSVDLYHQMMLDSFEKNDRTYETRWKSLTGNLVEFKRLSALHSVRPPVLMITPLMMDFDHYPGVSAHEDVGRLGKSLGYEVLDLLPVFRERLHDGTKYRSDPKDTHFNAFVHKLVAATLRTFLMATDNAHTTFEAVDHGRNADGKTTH